MLAVAPTLPRGRRPVRRRDPIASRGLCEAPQQQKRARRELSHCGHPKAGRRYRRTALAEMRSKSPAYVSAQERLAIRKGHA